MPSDPITIRVLATEHPPEEVDGVAKSRTRCLALSREFPAKWIVARRPDGETVHRLEPQSIVECEPEPEDEIVVLSDQEAMF